ncbi:MAG: hypothetical protein IT318_26940 [Anaerolineales bacterium]|nr:hypothetical protein [Anaerolineales bacterium]
MSWLLLYPNPLGPGDEAEQSRAPGIEVRIEALARRGGGYGLFTGCAAGGTAAVVALVKAG